jgi:16S rRNA (cytosine967-C5)-methyltransferase
MGNRGRVLATDTDSQRLSRIAENAARLGLTIIEPIAIDQLDAAIAAAGKPPDLILIDAPCSNTGVLARRPRRGTATLPSQSRRLSKSSAVARAGGRTVRPQHAADLRDARLSRRRTSRLLRRLPRRILAGG